MKKVILAINLVLFSSVLGMNVRVAEWASEWFKEAEIMELMGGPSDEEIEPDRKQFEWFNAAREGNLATIDRMIENGMDLNVKDMITGDTALIIATENGNCEMFGRIIAVDHSEVLNMILEWNNFGRKLSNESIIKWWNRIVRDSADVNAKNKKGRTALMNAAMGGYEEMMKSLINKGADVNAKDEKGRTALIEATKGGYEEIVESLINKGADVNAEDKEGLTALIWAEAKGYEKIKKLLIDNGANANADADADTKTRKVEAAVESGNERMVKFWLDAGADVSTTDGLLNKALIKGKIGIVELLVDAGVYVGERDLRQVRFRVSREISERIEALYNSQQH